MTDIPLVAGRGASIGRSRRVADWLSGSALIGATLTALVACSDPAVPNYQSPSVDPSTPQGIQQLVTGAFSGTRGSPTEVISDVFAYVLLMSSFGRDAGNFTNTDSRYLTEWLGDGVPIPNSDYYGTVVWDNEFRTIKNAQVVINSVSTVVPAYTTAQQALIVGVMQTWQAYNYMMLAETRDTNGVALWGTNLPTGTYAPMLCNKDVWAGIDALLDSGETNLVAGGTAVAALPVSLPPGFNSVSGSGAPGTSGSFAGFNRALRAKAGLEYAYAVARSAGGSAPTASTPGTPLASALTDADVAAKASFIFDGGTVEYVQLTQAQYADPLGVYHSFSGASGDIPNPLQGDLPTLYVLDAADSDIASDPRAGKIMPNSGPPGQPSLAAPAKLALTIGTYPSPNSPIPIVRNEDMVLLDAAIQLGLGNNTNAVNLINAVRTAAGAPTVTPSGYVAIRNQLLHELRASNLLEAGEYRTILIRDYGLEDVDLTTWGSKDLHTMVEPIPESEVAARGGSITLQCQ
jgi:hypothetical protein